MEQRTKGYISILIIILLCVAGLLVVNTYAAEIGGGVYSNVVLAPTPVPTTTNLTPTPTPTPVPVQTPIVGSYAIVTDEGFTNRTLALNGTDETRIIEVYQGDTVYWNDVCDLRLIEGWYGKLVHKNTGKVVDISSFTRKILIDPETFTPGEWDQWSDFDFDEDHGNTVAFYVKGENRPKLNLSDINAAIPKRTTLKPYIQPIPEKSVSDFLVAQGNPLIVPSTDTAKIWLFGRSGGYYGIPSVDNVTTLSKEQIQNLSPGNYILVVEQPSDGRVNVNMRYDPEKDRIEYFDPVAFEIKTIDFYGLDPKTRLDKFRKIKDMTKDTFTEYNVVISEPMVDIMSLDQTYHRNNTAAQTIRGYTNAAIGTPLTVVIDKDKHFGKDLKYSTFEGIAKGNPAKPGDMRWFEISVPLLFDNFGAGHHSIEVSTAIGGSMNVDYHVYEAPEHSFIPNNTIKYVNGSEWRPDPPPKIIEKEVIKIVETRVEVPVPPSQEQVTKTEYDAMFALAVLGIGSAILLGILGFLSWYFGYTYARYRQWREEER